MTEEQDPKTLLIKEFIGAQRLMWETTKEYYILERGLSVEDTHEVASAMIGYLLADMRNLNGDWRDGQ